MSHAELVDFEQASHFVAENPFLRGQLLIARVKNDLAERLRVEEVTPIIDKWAAFQILAKRAKNTELLKVCIEIRMRAERRAGQLLALMAERGERDSGHGDRQSEKAKSHPATQLSGLGVTKTESSRWQQLFRLPEEKFEIRLNHAGARVEGATTSAPNYSKATYTGENEWFTPAPYLDAARAVLGEIDLDPASHVLAQERVRAKTFFTAADNGLERPWRGRVWLNPPYCRALLAPFVDKLVAEFTSARVSEAILLTHNYTDTEWFHTAARAAQAICFPRGRVHFVSPAGEECSPTQGQAFFYFGGNDSRFLSVFSGLGLVVRPI
jgi:phage N-6-adenine-methyltransferase